MRFARSARLLSRADFRYVFEQPQMTRDPYFRILSRLNGGEASRLGMAVSRKVCRQAVGRNRLKRLIRESFRAHRDALAGPGRDIVVLPNARAVTISNPELFAALDAHWRKIKTLDARPGDVGVGKTT